MVESKMRLMCIVAHPDEIIGKLEMHIDGEARSSQSWAPWAVTSCVNSEAQWPRVLAAILCHKSQLPNRDILLGVDEMTHRRLWGGATLLSGHESGERRARVGT